MSYRPPNPARRVVSLIIVLGIVIGVGFQWGGQIADFVTGQDILDELRADLNLHPAPTPTPAIASAAALPAEASGSTRLVSAEQQLAPDGFPVQARRHVLRYTVQAGDTLFGIAARFGIDPSTIFWANTETLQDDAHLIQVGTQLYILPVDGVYHVADGTQTIAAIAAEYGATPGDIIESEYNELSAASGDTVPPAGLHIVVPGGRRDYISWRAPIHTDAATGLASPQGELNPGSCHQAYTGVGGTGTYLNPMGSSDYHVTQDFFPWHSGIDLAADPDAPIHAADTGIVVFAGWNRDGYGELVILDHGGGWTSYYGHLDKRYVDCGQQVTQGDLIGAMGMTGNATGIHLHFEVRQNDLPLNPRKFIEFTPATASGG